MSNHSPPRGYVRLALSTISLDEANAFVARVHRHHGRVVSHKFSLAALDDAGRVRGVAIVGRPVARGLDDGKTLEVVRLATDEAPNACSFLYARAARALGYTRIVTYVLASETGTSLRASGWTRAADVRGRAWSCESRPRPQQGAFFDGLTTTVQHEDKVRWEKALA